MFIPSLTSKLLQKLNSNSHNVTFRGGSLLQVANDKFEFKTYTNYYTETTTAYIPVMFDYVSVPKNIPNKEVYDYTVDITFALTGENESELENQRKAINDFRAVLINQPSDTVVMESETRNIVTSATDISLIRDVVIVNAQKRILVSMQVFVQSGIGIVFGNNRIVELKPNTQGASFITLSPFDFNIVMQRFTDAEMEFIKDNVESVTRTRSMTINMKLFHEDTALLRTILNDITGVGAIEQLYRLRFKIPNTQSTYVGGNNGLLVVLTDGTISSSNGTQNILDLNFRLAFNIGE
jgi:hypothetical protein